MIQYRGRKASHSRPQNYSSTVSQVLIQATGVSRLHCKNKMYRSER